LDSQTFRTAEMTLKVIVKKTTSFDIEREVPVNVQQ